MTTLILERSLLPILTSPNLSNFESLKNFSETKKNEDNITILLKTHQYNFMQVLETTSKLRKDTEWLTEPKEILVKLA